MSITAEYLPKTYITGYFSNNTMASTYNGATIPAYNNTIDDFKGGLAHYVGVPWIEQTEIQLEETIQNYNTNLYITGSAENTTNIYYVNNTIDYTACSYIVSSKITTDITSDTLDYVNNAYAQYIKPLTKRDLLKQQLRQNLTPQLLFRRFGAGKTSKDSEKKARETLQAIIGDQKFQRYLKHGFITVRGKSGLVYQIFPGHNMTRVWNNGKPVEKLCVVFCDSSIPPTDSVIMRMLMILDGEEEFRKQANKFNFSESEIRQPLPSRIAA